MDDIGPSPGWSQRISKAPYSSWRLDPSGERDTAQELQAAALLQFGSVSAQPHNAALPFPGPWIQCFHPAHLLEENMTLQNHYKRKPSRAYRQCSSLA